RGARRAAAGQTGSGGDRSHARHGNREATGGRSTLRGCMSAAPRFIGPLVVIVAALASSGLSTDTTAERPKASVDVPTGLEGRAVSVAAGANLQAALDQAQPGDVITLEPGASYAGPFTLPKKSGTEWITITTA